MLILRALGDVRFGGGGWCSSVRTLNPKGVYEVGWGTPCFSVKDAWNLCFGLGFGMLWFRV